jgi:hypothetical protein
VSTEYSRVHDLRASIMRRPRLGLNAPGTGAEIGQSTVEAAGRLARSEPPRYSKSSLFEFPQRRAGAGVKNQANKERKQPMKVEAYVAGVFHEVWFRGSRDERQVTLLNCLDQVAHNGLKLKQTFDYTPTKDEDEAIELEKLDGLSIVLAVEEIKAANGGRLKFKGKIDRGSVPKQALRNNGAGSAPAKTQAAAH